MIYASRRDDREFAGKYSELLRLEAGVETRWRRAIENMKEGDLLVVCSPALQDFVDFAVNRLGERSVILTENITMERGLWDDLLDEKAKMGLARDLMEMFWRYGYHWTSQELVQPVVARGWAERLKSTLRDRGFAFDPLTVQSEGWGESFEGCVATYTSFLRTYLGLRLPITPRFEMTVPDSRFLFGARQPDVIDMGHDVLLYVFRTAEGRMAGWYHRTARRIAEPALRAVIDPQGMALEVWNRNKLIWPSRESEVRWKGGMIEVPVSQYHFVLAKAKEKNFVCSLSCADLILE